jgi:putative addiction module component (TIGR02574 family)
MISKDELISEVVSLPVDIRLQLVERLLQSLNPPNKEVDDLWAVEAERRVGELERREVKTVPGDEVFKKLRDKQKK